MKTRVLAAASAATTALVAGALLAPPVHASVSWTKADATGDVVVVDDGPDLTEAERQSIDISQVRVWTTAAGGTKVRVTIDSVLPDVDDFAQMVFIDAHPKRGHGKYPRINAGWTPQEPDLGFAYRADDDESFVSCDPLPTPVVNEAAGTITQRIPQRCTAPGKFRITVTTATGFFRSEGPGYSYDKVSVVRRLR